MVVPDDVVRVRVHPSVTIISADAFMQRKKLEEVELCEGLLEIGRQAFYRCGKLKHISLPSTLRTIKHGAFEGISLHTMTLHVLGIMPFVLATS